MSLGRFRAGCGRETDGPADLADLAYTELAYPECPGCPHRVEPEDGPAFCRWVRTDLADPFRSLAGWIPVEEPSHDASSRDGESGDRESDDGATASGEDSER